jgi:hypothetical protein
MSFKLNVGALVAMMAALSVVIPVSATLHLRKAMVVKSPRKTQFKSQQQKPCDVDLVIVSFEYCFYTCGLDEAECQDLIESSTRTNATAVANCTNDTVVANQTSSTNVTAVVADSGDEGDPIACESNPSGFELVEAFLTVSDATAYCSDTCGLGEEECKSWKQRYILAEMQRRRRNVL